MIAVPKTKFSAHNIGFIYLKMLLDDAFESKSFEMERLAVARLLEIEPFYNDFEVFLLTHFGTKTFSEMY